MGKMKDVVIDIVEYTRNLLADNPSIALHDLFDEIVIRYPIMGSVEDVGTFLTNNKIIKPHYGCRSMTRGKPCAGELLVRYGVLHWVDGNVSDTGEIEKGEEFGISPAVQRAIVLCTYCGAEGHHTGWIVVNGPALTLEPVGYDPFAIMTTHEFMMYRGDRFVETIKGVGDV